MEPRYASSANNPDKMRIAYIVTSLSVGGAERQVIGLAERMAARGHAVRLIVLRPRMRDAFRTKLDVFFLSMRKTPWSVIGAYLRARRSLRGFQPDVIHGHNFHGNLLARFLGASFAPWPVISTIHNVYEGGWLRMAAYRWTDWLCDASVAVSQAVADRYVRLGAVPRGKCHSIANGIDAEQFVSCAERRAQMRAQMGVAREFVWLTAGRIVRAKDYPNLLRAFARVREAEPAAQLWIAGDGDGSYAAGLRKWVEDHGLHEAVRWLGMRRDMAALLDAADAFVLASAWEGMPLALGEAMAMEKPVVATDVGGVRELAGDAGLLVPAKDSAALADAMLHLMSLPLEQRMTMGSAARERIQRHFDIDSRAGAWEPFYRSLLLAATNIRPRTLRSS
jgi:glycosyltransferase involved in cell wall biosynthesis